MPRTKNLNPNLCAFLDMIAWSEIGPELLAETDDGYNVIVGSTPTKPVTFDSYSAHPRHFVPSMNSDAAGRYQFMGRYWLAYRQSLGLPDFGPESQDRWAIQLIRECHAMSAIESGNIALAIHLCKSRWASLPGAGYGQHEHALQPLLTAYQTALGAKPSSAT